MNLLHIDDNSLPFDVPEFENKLFLSYENEWLRKINQLPKLQLYKSIKTREKLSMCQQNGFFFVPTEYISIIN